MDLCFVAAIHAPQGKKATATKGRKDEVVEIAEEKA